MTIIKSWHLISQINMPTLNYSHHYILKHLYVQFKDCISTYHVFCISNCVRFNNCFIRVSVWSTWQMYNGINNSLDLQCTLRENSVVQAIFMFNDTENILQLSFSYTFYGVFMIWENETQFKTFGPVVHIHAAYRKSLLQSWLTRLVVLNFW